MSQDNAAAPTEVDQSDLRVIPAKPEAAAGIDVAEPVAPRIPAGRLTLVTVALACVVAIAEINRLTGALRDKQDRAVSLMTFVGPSRLWTWEPSGDEAFGRLADGGAIAVVGLRWWLLLYVFLHVIALGCALALAYRALRISRGNVVARWALLATAGAWLVVDVLVVWLALLATKTGAEVTSAALTQTGKSPLTPFAAFLANFAGIAASLGWVLALIVGLLLVRRLMQEGPGATRPRLSKLRRVGRAVFIQRFSVFVAAVIGGLVVLPGGEIRDQFPDAVRAWTDGELSGAKDAVVAVLALVSLAVVVFLMGRLRSTWVWRQRVTRVRRPAPDRAVYLWWLAVAGFALVGALVVAVLHLGAVDLAVLGLFAGAIAAVPLVSLLVGRFRPQASPGLPPQDESLARLVWVVGDVAAGSLLAIGGLGLVRAYTAPAVLGFSAWSVVALVVGGLVAASVWWVVASVVDSLNHGEGSTKHLVRPDVMTDLGPKLGIGLGVVAALSLTFVLFKPLTAASWFGVIGMTTAVLGCLVTLAALAVLTVQRNDPLPVFRLLGLKHTPLLTLLFLVPFLASLGGGDVDVHRVRVMANPASAELAVSQRPSLAEAFDDWLTQTDGCTGTNDVAGHPVRPLVLVAAAGGGIRAAVWTAYGVDQLAQHCGSRPIFLSSGVSGGSLGLALARGEGYTDAAETLAEPGALTQRAHFRAAGATHRRPGQRRTGRRRSPEATHLRPVRRSVPLPLRRHLPLGRSFGHPAPRGCGPGNPAVGDRAAGMDAFGAQHRAAVQGHGATGRSGRRRAGAGAPRALQPLRRDYPLTRPAAMV